MCDLPEEDDGDGYVPVLSVEAPASTGGATYALLAELHYDDEANARLIAAAPELLDAVRALVGSFNVKDDGSDDRELERWLRGPMKNARAVIAKAEGP